MRILTIEDDDAAANYVVKGLSESGHVADRAADGETGLSMALSEPYDALIVDRMLPGQDGLSLVRRLRALDVTTPVLFLTAHGVQQWWVEILVYFRAKPGNMNIDDVGLWIKMVVPDMFQQHGPGHHLAGMAHQEFQQFELAGL